MGYKVKWVEENLGVSRKTLRNFEKIWTYTFYFLPSIEPPL